ncbi:MAG: HAD family hydrolase [Promethearchaeota archaeon]
MSKSSYNINKNSDNIDSHPLIIMYDFDGVILDSYGAILAAYSGMKNPKLKWNKDLLKKTKPLELIRRAEMGDTPEGSIQTGYRIFSKYEDLLPSHFDRIKFLTNVGRLVRVYEKKRGNFINGVYETMKKLHEGGVLQGICTNSEGNRLPYWLKQMNCEEYISAFTSRNDRHPYGVKPQPQSILNLVNKIKKKHNLGKINKSRVYFCGDTPSDIWAAQNAHIKSVAVLSGHGTYDELAYMGADFVLNSINDLLEIPQIKEYLEKNQ